MIEGMVILYVLFAILLGLMVGWKRDWLIACALAAALFGAIIVLEKVGPAVSLRPNVAPEEEVNHRQPA